MDSKESVRKSHSSMDTDGSDETNDTRSSERDKNSRKIGKIQNGMVVGERPKRANNTVETEAKRPASAISNPVVSNGAQSPRIERTERESAESSKLPCRSEDASGLADRISLTASTISNGRADSSAGAFRDDSKPPNRVLGTEAEILISRADTDMRNNVDYTLGIEKCPAKVACGADASSENVAAWNTTSLYRDDSSMNNIGGRIGSTSQGTCCYLRPNINGTRDDGAGSSEISRSTLSERRDSSSGNEADDLSDVEDYCIYTYKGNDDNPEMTNSRRSMNRANDVDGAASAGPSAGQSGSGRSSPEMDFLEMDFDPGPSCEQDTGDSDLASINEDIQNLTLDNVDSEPSLLNDLSGGKVVARALSCVIPETNEQPERNVRNDTEQRDTVIVASPSSSVTCTSPGSRSMPSTSAGLRKWEATSINRSIGCPLRESYGYHNTSGDLISPGENRDNETELWTENSSVSIPENSNFNARKNNLSSTLYHRMMAKKLMLNKQTTFGQSGDSNLESELCNVRLDGPSSVEKIMLWSEQEATVKQVTQIGTSACGATSAINALLALDVPFSLEVLVKGVATRLREPGTPLPRYLVSRSRAGATHRDVIRGLTLATNGAVVTKFFAFYPERNVSLSHWLHHWISRGAAPIATLNLQNCGTGSSIPDAWHHQMIFGVGQSGIYMTNPLECLPERLVLHQLVSPSILLVKRSDVLAHWNSSTDLTPLARLDQHWRKLNVLGQIVNMIRETMGERKQPANSTISASHIRIPASFQAGITLVMRTDSPAAEELLHTEQLPLL